MRYVAAYLLAVLGGKQDPASGDLEKILGSVGIEVDKTKLTKVIDELKGKSVEELIAQGTNKNDKLHVKIGHKYAATVFEVLALIKNTWCNKLEGCFGAQT